MAALVQEPLEARPQSPAADSADDPVADLGFIDLAWCGWTLRDGSLISREEWEATPGDVLSLSLLRAQIANHQATERQILVWVRSRSR